MRSFEERFAAVLDLIYEAATDTGVWSGALTAIADLTGSDGGILFGQSYDEDRIYFDFNGRLSDECNKAYQERHIRNSWNLHMQVQPVGRLVLSDEVMSLTELKRTSFYDEVLKPQSVAYNSMMALAARDSFRAAFNICRSDRTGPLDADGQRILRDLSPHLCRSLTLGFRMEGYKALQQAAFDVLDKLTDGAIVLDRNATVLYANVIARRLADEGVFNLRPKIGTRTPGNARPFNALIHQAALGNAGGAIGLQHPADGRRLTVLVSALRSSEAGRLSDAGVKDGSMVLFIVDPVARQAMALDRVMIAFDLTHAEARVALATSVGRSVPEVAAQLNISVNTVKTHLRRIFVKTGTRGQAELAALLSALNRIQNL